MQASRIHANAAHSAMEEKLALKHISGSRAERVDVLAPPSSREIVFGRDRDCHVRYSGTDDLVSRRHCKIVITAETPARYMAVDLGSRNGTFVNRQRVFGAVSLQPGCRVQLGAGGPEFEFRLENGGKPNPAAKGGKIRKPSASRGRRALAIIVPLAFGAAAYLAWARTPSFWKDWRSAQTARPKFTAAAGLASVAAVEAEWSVFERQTGAPLIQAYVGNERRSGGETLPLLEGAPRTLPAFVLLKDQRIEPLLVPSGAAFGRAVSGKWTAKGVIASASGAAIAPAPERKPWNGAYSWAADEPAGALFVLESGAIKEVAPLSAAQFPCWTASESGWLAERIPDEWSGEMRGRAVSRDDLRVEVNFTIVEAGRKLKAKSEESAGFVLVTPLAGVPPAGVAAPVIHSSSEPGVGQAVWVVGDEVEAGAIQGAGPDGRLRLSSPLCHHGGAVFDDEGRALAVCLSDLRPNGSDTAATVRYVLNLFKGVSLGESR